MKFLLLFSIMFICIFIPGKNFSQNLNPEIKKVPDAWIDSTSGYIVFRLSQRSGTNIGFRYYNNPFFKSQDNKDDFMAFHASEGNLNQIYSVNMETVKLDRITKAEKPIMGEVVGLKHRVVIYQSDDTLFVSNVFNHASSNLFVFDKNSDVSVTSLNADETIVAGVFSSGKTKQEILKKYPEESEYGKHIYNARIPHSLFVIDLKSRKMQVLLKESEWIDHVQFSPTDPNLLMFCYECPGDDVNAIWTINIKSGQKKLMRKPKDKNEIIRNEFWFPDGKTIWYESANHKSDQYFLVGENVETGKEVYYELPKNELSVDYNISPDKQYICGSGSDSTFTKDSKNSKWIFLYKSNGDKLVAEKLVDMSKHNYKQKPNVHFSPDGKWIVFTSNMFGNENVFAVEVAKSKQ